MVARQRSALPLSCRSFTMPQALRHKDVACFAFLRSSLECTVEWQPHGLFFDSRSILLVRMLSNVLERLDLNSVLFLFMMLKILSQSALLGYIARSIFATFTSVEYNTFPVAGDLSFKISCHWELILKSGFRISSVRSSSWSLSSSGTNWGNLFAKNSHLLSLHLCAFGDIQYISILKNFFFKWIGLSHIAAC